MNTTSGRILCGIFLASAGAIGSVGAAETNHAELARKAQAILKANCHRCHGQDGAVEGGMNYILDRDKLVGRKKIVPGKAEESPLFKRVAAGKMPPPEEKPRPGAADIAVLKQWIEVGAPAADAAGAKPKAVTDSEVGRWILGDLENQERRSRRFIRYFSLVHLYNAGLGDDELQTYRHALSKLVNSLSWHPRLTLPKPIDPAGTLLRIDLRDFQWDANLWNRILAEYPYGILRDTADARAGMIFTGTKLPVIRADWFIATASRPPLYAEILQLPANLAELERQLRVDVALNIQQERVARAGFNGSGISKNNRLIERHDAVHGAYWRSYDFDAVPQDLVNRDNLLPDRRNLFAYPLGPGSTENTFQHAGGEIIFNLPNGLQGYVIVNANNVRIDKAPTAIVSDPKRPDRAVETGISCIGCHYRGINPKSDQIRDHVSKNPKAFSKADAELIRALYVPEAKMKSLMDEDAERFRKAVEKTGNRITSFEPVMTMTVRYETDVDLPTAAAEVGVKSEELLAAVGRSEPLTRNLGALKTPGGTVHRQIFIQSFGDLVRELRLGVPLQPGLIGQSLPDNRGEIDPLEGISSAANGIAFSPDRKLALFASADKSLRVWDVEAGREVRRLIGHTASVWVVAISPDGKQALSAGADKTVRLWDLARGQELRRLEGHTDLITSVAFTPDGQRAVSGGLDHTLIFWDVERGTSLRAIEGFHYPSSVAFSADSRRLAVCAGTLVHLLDAETGKEICRLQGHTDSVSVALFSADGRHVLSCSDDRTLRWWDTSTRKEVRVFRGHEGQVKCLAFSPDGRRAVSGGADRSVRLWDLVNGRELGRFTSHADTVVGVAFWPDGRYSLSGSRDAVVRVWELDKK